VYFRLNRCFRLDSRVVLGEISLVSASSREQVVRAMKDGQKERVVRLLATFKTRDPDEVEDVLAGIEPSEGDVATGAALVQLLEAPWHRRHEDIARFLQIMGYAPAVDALERTAQTTYPYLDYDEFFGLARKCTWALADIGTPAAHAALERLSQSDNPDIAGYALKRLNCWNDELPRKANPKTG
jgi:hypothetical protein